MKRNLVRTIAEVLKDNPKLNTRLMHKRSKDLTNKTTSTQVGCLEAKEGKVMTFKDFGHMVRVCERPLK